MKKEKKKPGRFCIECGTKVTRKATFCSICGTKLDSEKETSFLQKFQISFSSLVARFQTVPRSYLYSAVVTVLIISSFALITSDTGASILQGFRQCDLSTSSELAIKSVVKINTDMGSGSGFFIDSQHVVTNNHVLEGVSEAEVTLSSGKKLSAKVVGGDPKADIAVLEVEPQELPYLEFAKAKEKLAVDVVAIGYPLSEEKALQGDASVTKGTLSAYRDGLHGIRYIQTDTSINPGNSGGPLINSCGEIIGVNDMFYKSDVSADPIFYAIYGKDAQSSVKDIIQNPTYSVVQGTLPRFEDNIKPEDIVTAYYESLYQGSLNNAYQLFSVSRQKEWEPEEWQKLFDDVVSVEVTDIEKISDNPVKVKADLLLYTSDGFNFIEEETESIWTLKYSLGRLALDSLDVKVGERRAIYEDEFEEAIRYNKSLADTVYPEMLGKDLSRYPQSDVIILKKLITQNQDIISTLYSKVTKGEPLTEEEITNVQVFVSNHSEIQDLNAKFENLDLENYYRYYFGE